MTWKTFSVTTEEYPKIFQILISILYSYFFFWPFISSTALAFRCQIKLLILFFFQQTFFFSFYKLPKISATKSNPHLFIDLGRSLFIELRKSPSTGRLSSQEPGRPPFTGSHRNPIIQSNTIHSIFLLSSSILRDICYP